MSNPEVAITLEEAVTEILSSLTGLDLQYDARYDRFRAITRQLNKALRLNALEKEWSYYSSTTTLGQAVAGQRQVWIPPTLRARVINDDAVRLVDSDGNTQRFAYFLPRDAVAKHQDRGGLWCGVTNGVLEFSRPFSGGEGGLDVVLPVMREPIMFRLPAQEPPLTPHQQVPAVDQDILDQEVDFQYPDVVVMRAMYLYAQTDPVMQPRVQTIEAQYKDLMYQVIERDDRFTDSPFLNEFFVPVQGDIHGVGSSSHWHPHSDERR